MNNKIYTFFLLLCCVVTFSSCSEDDGIATIDEGWKAYNEKQIKEVIANSDYKELESYSKNGAVYWKNTDFIADNTTPLSVYPIFTDSVVVRYEGWYMNLDNTKYVFDTTEGDANSQAGRGFRISSGLIQNGYPASDGFVTMLQNMKLNEEAEVIIPYSLGYGTSKYVSIPAYTTLRFKIKLLKIIKD